jgi:TonB family protein
VPKQSSAEAAARQELNVGARAYRDGRFAEAEQHFRRARELDPSQKNATLFIARAIQQQYKPGVATAENIAVGERAVAAYQDIFQTDPQNDDAFKTIVFLYGQMKRDDKVRELLLWRANDFSAPNEKRAQAFVILASRHWNCSYDITEQKENKKIAETPIGAVITYTMPADAGDFIKARQCVTDGLQLVEQAIALEESNANARAYKAKLLREASKLAEMEGDKTQKDEYDRQYAEALEAHKRLVAGSSTEVTGESKSAHSSSLDRPAPPPPTDGATAAPRKVIVSGGVLNGKAVYKPAPEYPAEAKAAGAQGTVTVRVVIDEEGNVVEAEAVSGHPLLQVAAVAAARQAKFSQTRLSGQLVQVSGVVTYNFVLR